MEPRKIEREITIFGHYNVPMEVELFSYQIKISLNFPRRVVLLLSSSQLFLFLLWLWLAASNPRHFVN